MRWWPLLALLILCIPLAEAVSVANTTLATSSSGTNVTFTTFRVDCDIVDVESTYITITRCVLNNSFGGVSSTINFTFANNVTDSAVFPRITASSGNVVTISNGLNFSVPVSINVSTNGIVPSTPALSFSNGSSEYPSYSYDNVTGLITFNVSSLPFGSSVLTLVTGSSSDTPAEEVCEDNLSGLSSFGGSMVFVAGIILLCLVFMLLWPAISGGMGQESTVDIRGAVWFLAIISLVFVVVGIMLSALGGVVSQCV